MPSQQAEDNACRAEHALDSEVIDRLVCFLNFLKDCPRTGEVWLRAFDRLCQGRRRGGRISPPAGIAWASAWPDFTAGKAENALPGFLPPFQNPGPPIIRIDSRPGQAAGF